MKNKMIEIPDEAIIRPDNKNETWAQDKAKELFDKFEPHSMAHFHEVNGWDMQGHKEQTKECAIICVDEIINELNVMNCLNDITGMDDQGKHITVNSFWQQVKDKINEQ